METKNGKSTANTAYGKSLPEAIEYTFEYNVYESNDELVAAKDELTLDEQRKVRNTERLNNARAKALQAALDKAGIVRPDIKTDEQLRLREMLKVLMSSGRFDEATAKGVAASTLGLTWAE
jgi:hypothetical protein